MKEDWMNKLIELLDEYDSVQYHKINHKIENWDIYRNVWGTDGWSQVWRYSKSFWFIKRLVDNDKIDYHNVLRTWYEFEDWVFYHYDDYYCLLILLAISSSPIEDLISYLK